MNAFTLPVIAFLLSSWFATRSLVRAPWATPRSRIDLAFDGGDAILALALAHTLTRWTEVPPWLWLVLVAPLAVGAAGTVLRWQTLPAIRPDRRPRRVIIGAVIHAVILAALLSFLIFA